MKKTGKRVTRREFIGAGGILAGSLSAASFPLAQSRDREPAQGNAWYVSNRRPLQPSAFVHLPLGAVKPRGWLLRQLQIQAMGLTGFVYSEFDAPTWSSTNYEEGVVALAFVLDDDRLKHLAKGFVDRFLSEPGDMLSFNTQHGLRYLIEYYEATGDRRILDWMGAYFRRNATTAPKPLTGAPDGNWGAHRAGENLRAAYWLYNQTGRKDILEIIARNYTAYTEGIADRFLAFPLQADSRWLSDSLAPGLARDKIPSSHAVDLCQMIKYPGMFYEQTGESKYKAAVFEGIERMDKSFGQVGGRITGHEHVGAFDRGREPTNGTELCSVMEYMNSLERLIEVFGEVSLADRLELLAFNSQPGTMTPDMWAHQYDQQANQVLVSRVKRVFDNDPDANIYGLNPHFPCCLANLHQGWPRLVENMWMATLDNGLAAVTYGPSSVTAKVGAQGQEVTILQDSEYPFDGTIKLQFKVAEPTPFPLYLRIPGWATQATVIAGGEKLPAEAGHFFKVSRTWQNDEVLELSIPMPVRVETRFNNAVAVLRGPLYFSLRIGQRCELLNWRRDPGTDRVSFPVADREIRPTTPWNFALAIDRDHIERSIQVERHEVGEFPFASNGEPLFARTNNSEDAHWKASYTDANGVKQAIGFHRIGYSKPEPVVLTVRGRRLPQWGMDKLLGASIDVPTSAANAPESPVTSNEPEEVLELIPYGCSRLRISEFPVLS